MSRHQLECSLLHHPRHSQYDDLIRLNGQYWLVEEELFVRCTPDSHRQLSQDVYITSHRGNIHNHLKASYVRSIANKSCNNNNSMISYFVISSLKLTEYSLSLLLLSSEIRHSNLYTLLLRNERASRFLCFST